MKAKELINLLQRYKPDAEVRVRDKSAPIFDRVVFLAAPKDYDGKARKKFCLNTVEPDTVVLFLDPPELVKEN